MRSGAPWTKCAASTAAGLSAPTQAATTTPAAAIITFALTVAGTSLVGHIGWTHPPQRATALDHGTPRGAACGPLPAQCCSLANHHLLGSDTDTAVTVTAPPTPRSLARRSRPTTAAPQPPP